MVELPGIKETLDESYSCEVEELTMVNGATHTMTVKLISRGENMLVFKFCKVVIYNDSLKFCEVCMKISEAPQIFCICYLILWEGY